jgi:hypothetical protein
MKNARQALARQLARVERLARQHPNDQKIAGALAEVIEILRIEVRALDQEGSAARAEAVAALARQALNVTESLMRLGTRAREESTKMTPDFTASDRGTVWLLQPHTEAARRWLDENVPEARGQEGALIVEHGCIEDILGGIEREGLSCGRDE